MKKIILTTTFFVILTGILILNHLFYFSASPFDHLMNIKQRLENGEAFEMQKKYPEGAFFSYALYGSTWINIGLKTQDATVKQYAIQEVIWTISHLDSQSISQQFVSTATLEHGVFYSGWINRLKMGILLIDKNSQSEEFINQLHTETQAIADAFADSPTVFLESYPNQTWPADNIPALSSLVLHDKLFPTNYKEEIIQPWKKKAETTYYLDKNLFPHQIHSMEGTTVKSPRGASSAILLSFLPEVDQELSTKLFQQFTNDYIDRLMISLTREYEKDLGGKSNTNSGPILFNYGAVASIVSIGMLNANTHVEEAETTFNVFDVIGLPTKSKRGNVQYFGGKFLLYDILLTWGRTHHPWM